MDDGIKKLLMHLERLILEDRFENLETDTVEIKPVPAMGNEWKEITRSVNAMLNTRGGLVIFGVKEVNRGDDRRYSHTGWRPDAEGQLTELPKKFTDRRGGEYDVSDHLRPPHLVNFRQGRLCLLFVDELPADKKYVFYEGNAYKRIVTGDHRVSTAQIESQEEFREEAIHARELQIVRNLPLNRLDIDRLNEYITLLNKPIKVETIKPDLESALTFLHRKCFVVDESVTVLGALVCAEHPEDYLGFGCQVHGYVDVPHEIARDKQDLIGNIVPLMEVSLSYILRNIQVGVSLEQGGISKPQYPEELLRETVNNALAHRNYTVNRQVIISIKPGQHVSIANPGSFREHLLIQEEGEEACLRRIIPEAKPRNPKLADVLRVFRKWEGRGIGMATLVDLALKNEIDLPYYRFATDEVTLFLCAGKLLDERMERLFQAYDAYIADKLNGNDLTVDQKRLLAYLIKSEWANQRFGFTILITPGNDHFHELVELEKAGLISKHTSSTPIYPVYIADRILVQDDVLGHLRHFLGSRLDRLDSLAKQVLCEVYRYNTYSKAASVNAKQAAFALWHQMPTKDNNIKAFDDFYRKVRFAFNKLEERGYIVQPTQYKYRLAKNLPQKKGGEQLDLTFD